MALWASVRPYLNWRVLLPLMAAAFVGAGATIASVEFNRHTSTDKFCTSCHSMAPITADPHYLKSAHVSNSAGVRPNCGNCHVPTNNWFVETYVHVSSGIRDVIAEATFNFDDREAWNERRRELARGVHEKMRAQGNVTCKSCHTPESIKPASQTGQAIHAALPEDMACVSCHRNLVHERPGSRSADAEISMIKRAADDWVHSRHLSNLHAQKGVGCSSCHGNDLIPVANANQPSQRCATCHGGMEQIAQNFKGPSNLNPHASHLGDVPCASCHVVHQTSKASCLNCHKNFRMPIPGGEDVAAETTKP